MKTVIHNLLFDTDTAEKIAEYSHGYAGDFKRFEEILYRTKNGNWFLYGEGGPSSKYGKAGEETGTMVGSRMIEHLIMPQEIINWLSDHGEVEVIEKYFQNEIQEG